MKKYIQFLLQDLENAKSIIPPKPNYKLLYPDHPAFQFGLDYIVEWEMSPEIPMENLFEINVDQFPKSELLTTEQLEQVIEAIIELWEAHRIDANMPESIPPEIMYNVIINQWSEPFAYVQEGFMSLDFCNYRHGQCPFGNEYCDCNNGKAEVFIDFTPTDFNSN